MNTKQDYLNLIHEKECKQQLQQIIDNRFIWQTTSVLLNKEDGIEDDTHRILEDDHCFIQQQWIEDPNCELFRLGFTLEEAQSLLK